MTTPSSRLDYVCPTGRLQCSCCYDQLSLEQNAYQRGAVHFGYGWARNPSGSTLEADAYNKGYFDARGKKGPFAA